MPKYVAIFTGAVDLPSKAIPGLADFVKTKCRAARQISGEVMAFDYTGSQDELFQHLHTKLGKIVPVVVLTVESAQWAQPTPDIEGELRRFFEKA